MSYIKTMKKYKGKAAKDNINPIATLTVLTQYISELDFLCLRISLRRFFHLRTIAKRMFK